MATNFSSFHIGKMKMENTGGVSMPAKKKKRDESLCVVTPHFHIDCAIVYL